MLKQLKVKHPAHDLFFTSDLHIGHDKPWIIKPRGFDDVVKHDDALIKAWNETCASTSLVFHLGDLCFKDPDGKRCRALIRRLTYGTLYLMLGNHTSGQSAVYKDVMREVHPWAFDGDSLVHEVYPLEAEIEGRRVVFLPEYVETTGADEHLVLSHYPIISHHKLGAGAIHLTGHAHGSCAVTNRDKGRGKRLDVGVDTFGRPVSLSEIMAILRHRDIDSWDHHGERPPE